MTISTRPVTASASRFVPRSRTRSVLRFAGHYAEMVAAMVVGMIALGPLWSWAAPGLTTRPDTGAVIMATNMTVGMTLWMMIRRHSRRSIAEMAAAMYVPFLALLVPYWFGLISAGAVMTWGHILMLIAMLAVMLPRPGRGGAHHH